ncbi:hypothetical protein LIER_29048 [Lithospermum erythrorhizon]|uniref:F-box associated beta-propeller type 3 domain-containing protein n=1 Tax=Lithospermum erythrorhizon TaxID=34254 RepID=A0AAV3RLD2_LITER
METLVRYRSVCKLWCNIVDDPLFVYMHLVKGPVELVHMALCRDEIEEDKQRKLREKRIRSFNFHLLKLDKRYGKLYKLWKKSENPTNIKSRGQSFTYVVGSYKGLVCFIREKKLHIVNPLFFNDILTVPLPPRTALSESHDDTSYLSYSFGFDELSKSFKVICILNCRNLCGHRLRNAPLVLDLGIGMSSSSSSEITWRMLSSPLIRYPCMQSKRCQSLFVDGAFLFWGTRRSPGCGNLEILSFNLEKGTFKVITLPIARGMMEHRPSLFDFDGFVDNNRRIWVLISDDENNSGNTWTEIVKTKPNFNRFESITARGFYKYNCDIMFKIINNGYRAYNMKTGIITDAPHASPGVNSKHILLHQGSLICASNLTQLNLSS